MELRASTLTAIQVLEVTLSVVQETRSTASVAKLAGSVPISTLTTFSQHLQVAEAVPSVAVAVHLLAAAEVLLAQRF